MIRAAIITILLLLGLSLSLGYLVYSGGQTIAELEQTNKGLTEAAERAAGRAKLDRQVLVARQAENVAQRRKLAKAQEALSEALQHNKEWNDTDVPLDVQQALQQAEKGLPEPSTGPVPAEPTRLHHD